MVCWSPNSALSKFLRFLKHPKAMTQFHFSTSAICPGKLLIIDDVPENIGVLFNLLSGEGYEILIAEEGGSGLQTAINEQPDVILLDVMMPDMDGFEVCRRLKQNPLTQDVPVIFLTALTHMEHRLSGFRLGAVDYITKPIQHEEVSARVRTHSNLRRLQREQAMHIAQLQERNAELDAFAHTVAHDLKNPLGIISGLSHRLCQHYSQEAELLDNLQDIRNSAEKMREIIDALLLLARVSKQHLEPQILDMNLVMQQVMQRLQPMLAERQAQVRFPAAWPQVYGQPQWIEEVWMNYLTNGLKYGGTPPYLEIGAAQEGEQACFWVKDQGPGLSLEAQEKIFTPFTRLRQHSGEEGHGLGLSIVERIIAKLSGRVGVESQEGQGSRFFFTLPSVAQAAPIAVQLHQAPHCLTAKEAPVVVAPQAYKTVPTHTDLQQLIAAARMGDILWLQEILEQLCLQDQTLKAFCQEVTGLAQDMRIKQLRMLLEKYAQQTQA